MTIDRIRPHDPIKAADQNALIAQVNRLARPGATGRAQYGTAGLAFLPPPSTRIGLFELTQPLTYPAESDQAPYTEEAKAVWFNHSEGTYGGTNQSPNTTLYHPTALRDSAGDYVGLPKMRAANRVWAWWNRQSGRWEIIQTDRQHVYRGKLDALLWQSQSATVSIWQHRAIEGDADTGVNVTACDWFLGSGEELAAGTKVTVTWFPDDNRWYVTGAEC